MVKMSELELAELATAYRATTYRVFLPGGHCDLRIDQPCQQLADWLKANDCHGLPSSPPVTPGGSDWPMR
jgi:hypothetical protein